MADPNAQNSGTTSRVLPRFSKPPIVEVAISVQFDELTGFKPAHFGLLWERLRARYPRTDHQPPLPTVIELFGTPGAEPAFVSVGGSFPIGRTWFLSEDGHRLIQVQPDRFILNWRKLDSGAEYPTYETLREHFQRELEIFLDFIDKQSLGRFEPTQCELTYVNHLVAGLGWTDRSELSNVIAPWSGKTSDAFLPQLEDARLHWQYRFDNDAQSIGRLHVDVMSALGTSDRRPLFVLQLTARGAPVGSGVEGVQGFTDLAHEWIVRGFTSLTTERMHRLWERES